ncbi:uncharacterized protein LACBIDRAFT_334168 [Laccaria bicolor S238N-H82]|uniref:Predicted protein n=1 Tax=Laccaria bicolor (strain S238N-H82 / ATCC MYA-4686) TaxID=486041 RepID=B0DYB2_LACBS|nr:uncharacterized protein LACBIDRAFT_334168 [Laccaria bicolor S238N-H82]EDR00407.1 predicted protein [Laccaria bicolor S238N-H82]|eukprot:XP_001888966.1 predicted protein [Laccaria bicolor S238N-H82]
MSSSIRSILTVSDETRAAPRLVANIGDLHDFVMATYQPPPPSRMQVSRSLPAPSQQQSANMNSSQPFPVRDKTYSTQANRLRLERRGTIHGYQIPVPCHHPIQATLLYQSMERDKVSTTISSNSLPETRPLQSLRLYIPGHDSNHAHPLSANNYSSAHLNFQGPHEEEQHQDVYPPGPSSSDKQCITPLSIPQTISPAEPSSSSSYSHTTYLPTTPTRVEFDPSMPINASDYVFSPSPATVPGQSRGIGIDKDEQRKSVPKVCPVGRSLARPKGREASKVHVPSGSTSTTSMSPLSDLLVPSVPLMPPVQVQANHRVVPQHRLHQGDSVQAVSSVPASTSSVPQSPQDKDKDATSSTTSTPTPAPFICPSGRSRVNLKARLKPSTTDPSPTPFKSLYHLIGKIKQPDKGKQREQDKQVEDGDEMQMMPMSMEFESTSNLSSSWCLIGPTVDLGVGVGWDEVAEKVSDIRRATDMGAENAYGGEHAMETGGKSRVGSYPLNPFDAVLLDHDRWTGELLRRLNTTDSPTFYDYGSSPPRQVLDLGCGQGHWVVEAAIKWSRYGTKVIGYDKVDISKALLPLAVEHRVKRQIEFIRGNFLNQLPFDSNTFDLIRMSCLTLCIPTGSWAHVFEEVYRVLSPGGRLELIEDAIIFPPQPPITPPLNFEFLFEHMLSKTYGISLHPETFISQMMKDIFGYGELMEVMHLFLAHRDPSTEEDQDEAAVSEAEMNPTTGLLLLPSTYLPMEAEELEMYTTRHMRTLLSCKHKLVEHAIETEDVNDELVQEALYEYESSMHQRFQHIHLDANGQVSDLQTSSDGMGNVRTFRVFGAIKMESVVFTSMT